MIDARLQVALDGGGLVFPDQGCLAVLRPPVEADLPGIDASRCHVVHDFKPFHDSWVRQDYHTSQTADGPCAAVLVCLPRAKAEARALIATACALSDGLVIIDGQKTDGIDSVLKDVRRRVPVMGPVSKAHGKMFWITAPPGDAFADWAAGPSLTAGAFWTAPGVFSADQIDLASALLADALPETLGGQVADLGAGWGFLSAHILTRPAVEQVHLVEAGYMALECARRNVTDPRATFFWEDALHWQPPVQMDAVVMNPPFHQGRASEPQIGQAFIAKAAQVLTAQGELWMVANRHLPYEAELKSRFTFVEELGGDGRFKLLFAARPIRRKQSKR